MTKAPSVFLSYCSANEKEAEQIHTDLQAVGINVIKDNHHMAYLDSIEKFMQSIRDADFALLLISEHYLKSRSCMYEVGQLFQEREAVKKVLPVLIDGTKLYGTRERILYVRYWQDEKKSLKKALKGIEPINAVGLYEDLRTISNIGSRIDSLLTTLSDLKAITLSKLRQQSYKPLLAATGFQDMSYLVKLLSIFQLTGNEDKELALDQYLTQYPANAFYYGVKAGVCRDAGKIIQARFNYEKAIESDPQHTEALNNLGELYRTILNDPAKACHYYRQAITVNPKHSIARLNLGYVLKQHFKDVKGAIEQYESILQYDSNSAKAHLNLASALNLDTFLTQGLSAENTEKVQFHYKEVIRLMPNSPGAYMVYGNFLKSRGILEEGNTLYRKAQELDEKGHFADMLTSLLKSTKG